MEKFSWRKSNKPFASGRTSAGRRRSHKVLNPQIVETLVRRSTHFIHEETSNTQRRTLNIEWSADGFCRETPTEEYRNNKTPPKYDLEDRLLDFAVNIVELTESLPTT